jgi:hypothetical protein
MKFGFATCGSRVWMVDRRKSDACGRDSTARLGNSNCWRNAALPVAFTSSFFRLSVVLAAAPAGAAETLRVMTLNI